MTSQFERALPIFRIFSVEKAKDFYIDFLGCKIDFEHRFEPAAPLYMQVSRGDFVLHLSEHHGDGTPGSNALVFMTGLDEFHHELTDKKYRYLRPGIYDEDWARG